ncbi:MAG: hypothetical protein PHH37_09135 [Paludibacter sp.]|nr:hypothetical protein [Paludibacter sp.]
MKKKIYLSFILFNLLTGASAQKDIIYKVPHQISLETGYRYVLPVIDHSNVLGGNSATNGYGIMLDYGWKVSGLSDKKANVYLTVPLGYTVMLPDNAVSKRLSMFNYGWTVRHEIGKGRKFTPFAGYGLLLNTLKVDGTEGGVMGHQTRFEFGTNMNTTGKLKYFAKVQYSYTSYPKLGDSKRVHFQYIDIRMGLRF